MMAAAYGPWVVQGTEFTEREPQPPAHGLVRLRLFCVPPAGMGGACYHGWTKGLPVGVEVMPLELPARGSRMTEAVPYARSVQDLACGILDGVGLKTFEEKPFVLLGHSFGAWVVYEMCQELLRRQPSGWPLPEKVYVSACRAPQLAGLEHDPDRVSPTLGSLSASEFWQAFERRYGSNPDLQEDYVREFVIGVLQADFGLLEAYKPSSLQALPVPLCALCAKGDPRCRPTQLSAWAACAPEGAFQERWFEDGRRLGGWANEHRYVAESPGSLLRFLHGDLPLVASPAEGYAGIAGPLPDAAQAPAPTPAEGASSGEGRERCMAM